MARGRDGWPTWKLSSLQRKDARQDPEYLVDEPSTGKVRGHHHHERMDHKHVYVPKKLWWWTDDTEMRCEVCDKREPGSWYRAWYSSYYSRKEQRHAPNPHNLRVIPIHERGTCDICDKRRS